MFDSSFFVAISFLIFVGLVIFMGLPKMIISALDKRSKDIQEELDEARNLREQFNDANDRLKKAEEENQDLKKRVMYASTPNKKGVRSFQAQRGKGRTIRPRKGTP